MSVSRTSAPGITTTKHQFRSNAVPDRAMRRVLGISEFSRSSGRGAHRAFRSAVVVSAIRCLITYLIVPILVPILSLSGWVAAPIGIALCAVAVVNGVVAIRRFWFSDHRYRWMYTIFTGVIFLILTIALYIEINRWMVIV